MNPLRGIGSVLPLPQAGPARADSLWETWSGGRPVAAFRSGRGALAAWLTAWGVRRLWLPAYACPALAEGAAGVEICWYGVDAVLEADVAALSEALEPGDACLAVAYFGRSPGPALRALAAERSDVLWIEDRAQALAPDGPHWAQVALYSPRKLVGVGEGGLLVGEGPLPAPRPSQGDAFTEAQAARRDDPDGLTPERWYPAFQAQEAAFDATPWAMNPSTRDLLQGVALEPLAAARRANYAALARALPDYALWPEVEPPFAPLAFPVRVADRDGVAARMAEDRIWCARHWPELPGPADGFAAVHALNAQLLSLPCDHRYRPEDMARVAERLRALAQPAFN